MKRGVAAALAGVLAACGAETAQPLPKPTYALRAVVAPALAEADARARAVAAPTPPSDDVREAAEAALSALESPDARMRGLALEDARAAGDPAVPLFAAALTDPAATPGRRAAAAQALGQVKTARAVDALATCLETDREPWLRANCAWQLAESGRDEVVPRLVLRLKYETDGATVAWIAYALAKYGNLAGLEGLRVVAATGAGGAGAEAQDRLATIALEQGFQDGKALYAAWWNGDPALKQPEPGAELRDAGWRWIARLSEPDLRKVDDARFILTRLDAWIVPLLCEALHDENVYTRVHAVQVLERRGPRARSAVPALLEALNDPRLAPGAAAALGAIGDKTAIDALEPLLRQSRDVELRVACARALGRLKATTALPTLRAALVATEPIDLRQAAARALVDLGEGGEVAGFLLECLTSPTADVGDAELALGRWIVARAPLSPADAERRDRWSALEPVPNSVPTADDVARRRSARGEIARAASAALRSE